MASTIAIPAPSCPVSIPTVAAAAEQPSTPPATPALGAILRPLLKPYRWHLALALLLNAIHGVAISFQTYAVPTLVGLLDPAASPPGWMNLWGDSVSGDPRAPRSILAAVATLAVIYLLVSTILRMAMWHLGYRISAFVRERVLFELRATFFRHVNHLCLRFHRNHPSGELFSYLFGTPLAQITQFFQTMALHVPGAVFNLIASVAILCSWDWYLSGLLLLMVSTSVLVLRRSLQKVNKLTKDFQAAEGSISGHIADLLHGNKAVKLYAMEEHVALDFEDKAKLLGRKNYEKDIKTHVEFMKQEVVHYIFFGALMLILTWRYQSGAIDLKGITAYMMYYMSLGGPMNQLYSATALWSSAQVSLQRIGTVLTTATTTPAPIGEERALPEKGAIVFENVSFAYAADGDPVIRDLNLEIPYGQRVAIVGPSGAGKSTIIQLLMRLYDPTRGSIRIGAVDLRQVEVPQLRRMIGVVPQDPFIFRTNLRENIRVARPEADLAMIRRACEQSNAWEFIEALPEGLDTTVGEGGSTLSGGQRQRLAIARVLLADPAFFVFDEATSALDTVSEHLIQQALERNLGGRTAIFIAHRLATVKNCDRILVLQDGQIAQDGPYDQLIAVSGAFRTLVEGQQLRMDRPAPGHADQSGKYAAAASARLPKVV